MRNRGPYPYARALAMIWFAVYGLVAVGIVALGILLP